MGGEELKWCTISYRASKVLILVHTIQLKTMMKAHSSGKMVSSVIDVVIASVHSEKTRLKKLTMMMITIIITIMNKSQEALVFSGHQKVTSAMKLRPEK